MGNYLKIKKLKIILTFLLVFNQLISSSYAINNKRNLISESKSAKFSSKYWRKLKLLSSSKKQKETYLLNKDVEDLEKFVEETFDSKNIDNLKNLKESKTKINTQINEISEDLINSDVRTKKSNKEENIFADQPQNIKTISIEKNLNQRKSNKLLLPSRSIISTSEFKVPPRGYVKLSGPKITLNLKEADSIETLKLIAKLGNYGILVIENKNSKGKIIENPKITANFEDL